MSLRTVAVRFEDARTGLPIEVSGPDDLARSLSAVATREESPRLRGTKYSTLREFECGRYVLGSSPSTKVGVGDACSGTLELHAAPPLWVHAVLRQSVLQSQHFEGDSSEIVFRIDTSALERQAGGLVVRCVESSTGRALVGAQVEADFENSGGLRLMSDGAGLARFERLAPGPRRISVWSPDHPMVSRVVNIEPGREHDLKVEVRAHTMVAGRVLGPDGRGMSAALEFLEIPMDAPFWWCEPARGWTDSEGRFVWPLVPAGRLRVVASSGYALAAVDVDSTHTEASEVTIWLENGSEVVLLAPRGAFRPLDVTLLDARGGWLASSPVLPEKPIRWPLSPGTYELRVFDENEPVETRSLVVEAKSLVIQLGMR